jgi:hypothetical protein
MILISDATTLPPNCLTSPQTKFDTHFFKSNCRDLNRGPLELDASVLATWPCPALEMEKYWCWVGGLMPVLCTVYPNKKDLLTSFNVIVSYQYK